MARIRLEGLSKRFAKHMAVQDVNLTIEDKELMVFLGPSGCGKSTTLNCIAGLETPTSGRVFFDDVDVTDIPPHRRNVAMVFQSSLLYPHLTAYQNIRMSLRLAKLSKEEEDRRIREVAATLEISHVLDRIPSQMSGGERQRTAIAKAIVREPAVFLMDEPLANLDAALREVLRAEIAVLQKKLGTTMVFVTHDQVEAMTIGDRITIMCKGQIQQVGTPEEIYNQPANVFVASFIGSPKMRLIQGTLHRRDGALFFEAPQLTIEVAPRMVPVLDAARVNSEVILGIRPQHMCLLAEPTEHAFEAEVYAVENLGKESIVTVTDTTGEKSKILTGPDVDLRMGEKVYVRIDKEQTVFFDSKSGTNCMLLAANRGIRN